VQNLVEPEPAEISRIEARSMVFSTDGRYLAVTYGAQVALYLLDSQGGVQRESILQVSSLKCAFRPDNTMLACQVARPWQTALFTVPDGRNVDGFGGLVTALGWSPDGKLLALPREGGIAILDVVSRNVDRDLTVDKFVAYVRVSFSANGQWLIGMAASRLDLWDTRTWIRAATLEARTEHGRLFQDAAFGPQSPRLAVTGGNQVSIWEARDQ